jgi:hypothetical protein
MLGKFFFRSEEPVVSEVEEIRENCRVRSAAFMRVVFIKKVAPRAVGSLRIKLSCCRV